MIDAHLEEDFDWKRHGFVSHREDVLRTFSEKLQIENNIDEIANCITFAYNHGIEDAIILATALNFSKADMKALDNDEHGFWEAKANELL